MKSDEEIRELIIQTIFKNPNKVFGWVQDVIKGRWMEGEKYIKKDEGLLKNGFHWWKCYLRCLKVKIKEKDKSETFINNWNEYSLEILNYLGMSKETQEYLIQQHPDLIAKIEHLDPILKQKYRNELNLAGIEI
jgi:hypothetical protein